MEIFEPIEYQNLLAKYIFDERQQHLVAEEILRKIYSQITNLGVKETYKALKFVENIVYSLFSPVYAKNECNRDLLLRFAVLYGRISLLLCRYYNECEDICNDLAKNVILMTDTWLEGTLTVVTCLPIVRISLESLIVTIFGNIADRYTPSISFKMEVRLLSLCKIVYLFTKNRKCKHYSVEQNFQRAKAKRFMNKLMSRELSPESIEFWNSNISETVLPDICSFKRAILLKWQPKRVLRKLNAELKVYEESSCIRSEIWLENKKLKLKDETATADTGVNDVIHTTCLGKVELPDAIVNHGDTVFRNLNLTESDSKETCYNKSEVVQKKRKKKMPIPGELSKQFGNLNKQVDNIEEPLHSKKPKLQPDDTLAQDDRNSNSLVNGFGETSQHPFYCADITDDGPTDVKQFSDNNRIHEDNTQIVWEVSDSASPGKTQAIGFSERKSEWNNDKHNVCIPLNVQEFGTEAINDLQEEDDNITSTSEHIIESVHYPGNENFYTDASKHMEISNNATGSECANVPSNEPSSVAGYGSVDVTMDNKQADCSLSDTGVCIEEGNNNKGSESIADAKESNLPNYTSSNAEISIESHKIGSTCDIRAQENNLTDYSFANEDMFMGKGTFNPTLGEVSVKEEQKQIMSLNRMDVDLIEMKIPVANSGDDKKDDSSDTIPFEAENENISYQNTFADSDMCSQFQDLVVVKSENKETTTDISKNNQHLEKETLGCVAVTDAKLQVSKATRRGRNDGNNVDINLQKLKAKNKVKAEVQHTRIRMTRSTAKSQNDLHESNCYVLIDGYNDTVLNSVAKNNSIYPKQNIKRMTRSTIINQSLKENETEKECKLNDKLSSSVIRDGKGTTTVKDTLSSKRKTRLQRDAGKIEEKNIIPFDTIVMNDTKVKGKAKRDLDAEEFNKESISKQEPKGHSYSGAKNKRNKVNKSLLDVSSENLESVKRYNLRVKVKK